ncbi:MAG TPA: heterodisulfide reductase [Dehalococcoidia bacterium]|nr:heterodisulfide reductase [Dehalococcoidia bacterium]
MSYRRSATSSITIKDQTGVQPVDTDFTQQVKDAGNFPLDRCYQCFTCTLGCPVAKYMDIKPDQIVRMVQLGLKQQVLTSEAIWICCACETCVTRCPNEIDVPKLMDTLKETAIREKITGKNKIIPKFHKDFLYPIKIFGKQYELGLIVYQVLKTLDFGDLGLGIKMILRNKLSFLPGRVKGLAQIKRIYEKTKQD